MSNKIGYRQDIDGLRAIAILPVLFFHLGVPHFEGGYVGVDVFFVISGYLITQLIINEHNSPQGFRFSKFFIRRVRRLYPALLFTVFVTLVAASLVFTPDDLERVGGAALHSIAGISNFYFWSESGYFNPSAKVKPLLHTWSLGVEEQFYLLWPLFLSLLLLFRSKWILAVAFFSIIGLVLLANAIFGPTTIFFLTPFRAFEFTIGALLILLPSGFTRNTALHEVFLISGLAMIGTAVVIFDDQTLFPTYNALLPCFGAAALLYGGQGRLGSLVLSNWLAIKVGQISYSLYLIHWPIITIYTYALFEPLRFSNQILLGVASFSAATFMYRYIEQPFRVEFKEHPAPSNKSVVFTVLLLTSIVVLPAGHMWVNDGWRWRVKDFTHIPEFDRGPCTNTTDITSLPCNIGDDEELDVIWLGDSLVEHYLPLIEENLTGGHSVYHRGGCLFLPLVTRMNYGKPDQTCENAKRLAFEKIRETNNKTVVISQYWDAYFGTYEDIIALSNGEPYTAAYKNKKDLMKASFIVLKNLLADRGHQLIVLNIVRYENFDRAIRCMNSPMQLCSEHMIDVPYAQLIDNHILNSNFFEENFKEEHIVYIDPVDNFCDETGACRFLSDEGRPFLIDHIHFSSLGAQRALFGRPQNIRTVLENFSRNAPH